MKDKHSNYTGVSLFKGDERTTKGRYNMKKPWRAIAERGGRRILNKRFSTEREAAIAYDKALIQLGEEPVNILKRKQ